MEAGDDAGRGRKTTVLIGGAEVHDKVGEGFAVL
jgi:hypothetical protein